MANKERIHQSLARKIGTAILSKVHKPGASLGGEIEQSKRWGVSRTAYREAIRILVSKGLIVSRPKAGTHVTAREKWNLLDPQILGWMLLGRPDDGFIRDLLERRGVIELAAAAMAAERRALAHLSAMRAALDDMSRFGLAKQKGQNADRPFHRTILDSTGNSAMLSLAGSVEAAVQSRTRFKQRAQPFPRDPVPDHRAFYEAIEAGNAIRARRATNSLLRLALADMKLGSRPHTT